MPTMPDKAWQEFLDELEAEAKAREQELVAAFTERDSDEEE